MTEGRGATPFRDPFGLHRLYYRSDGRGHGTSIRKLLFEGSRRLDPQGVQAFLARGFHPFRTCFQGIFSVSPGHRLLSAAGPGPQRYRIQPRPLRPVPARPLNHWLESAVRRVLERGQPYGIALSGGLDSALVLALVRRLTGERPRAWILSPRVAGYNELDRALATAEALGADPVVIDVEPQDLVAALPATVSHVECPLYNFHPVSKLLLARAMASDGVRLAFTGDGADQLFSGSEGADYLPLVGALFEGQGLEVCSPFLDDAVVSFARRLRPDPHKRALRAIARELLPPGLAEGPKRSGLAPPLDLSSLWDEARLERTWQALGTPPPALESDRARVGWLTLSILYAQRIEGGTEIDPEGDPDVRHRRHHSI